MSSKEILIRIILFLSDDLCDNIRRAVEPRIRPEMLDNERLTSYLLRGSSKWNEDDHPRAADGRWTNGAPGTLTPREAKKWEDIGHQIPSPKRFPETLKKLRKAQEQLEYEEDHPQSRSPRTLEIAQRRLAEAQRELAEKIREHKHAERDKIEHKAERRHVRRLVNEYRDIEEEIDYFEEKYADRDSGSLVELKWPKGKKAQKDRAKYESLLKRRDELNVEIDWDIVDDE